MNHADELRDKLNQAISDVLSSRGSYADDIRHFTRNRKLPAETLIKLLLTMTGGTIARELYDADIDIAVSSFIDRRKALGYRSFHEIMQRFNGLCEDSATLKGYRLWAIDGSTIPLPRNPSSNNHYTSDANPKGWNNVHANLLLDIPNQV